MNPVRKSGTYLLLLALERCNKTADWTPILLFVEPRPLKND
jgi:hypothetical protein